MKRSLELKKLGQNSTYDFIVIGGGASGLGVALDAVSRGFKTILFESYDFAKGTSSRSTKLVHGGVRYLQQGNIKLVKESLRERGILRKNARHLVHSMDFIIPNYSYWSGYYYNFGLWLYDRLAGKYSFGKTQKINRFQTRQRIQNLQTKGLKNSVVYTDGQFDDARLAIDIAKTITEQNGTVLNYMKVTRFLKDKNGKINGVEASDLLHQKEYQVRGKVVINATGVFTDAVLNMNNPDHTPRILLSQGIHLTLDKSFVGGNNAIMIPHTTDGRVLYIIPWHDKVLMGTTDTPMQKSLIEPRALETEIDFVLHNAQKYLLKKPTREDVLSVFAGLRPLAAPKKRGKLSKKVSRSHKIVVEKSGLISLLGGKWTTYRKMAEDTVNKAIKLYDLPKMACKTKALSIHGNLPESLLDKTHPQSVYGADLPQIKSLENKKPAYAELLHPKFPYTLAQVVWAIREEMAESIEDVLARRIRLLFLDAQAAMEAAPAVAQIFKEEKGWSDEKVTKEIEEFEVLAQAYVLNPL